jgi:molecular chaperone DnaK
MRKEAEAHAEEDRRRKELIEARNTADNAIYTAEKALRDLGEKVPAEVKKQVEEQVAKVRSAMSSDNIEEIKGQTDKLFQVIQQIGASAYQSSGPEAGQAQGTQGGAAGENPPGGGGEDVVDGEFRNVGS